jgi:hypothetical protein
MDRPLHLWDDDKREMWKREGDRRRTVLLFLHAKAHARRTGEGSAPRSPGIGGRGSDSVLPAVRGCPCTNMIAREFVSRSAGMGARASPSRGGNCDEREGRRRTAPDGEGGPAGDGVVLKEEVGGESATPTRDETTRRWVGMFGFGSLDSRGSVSWSLLHVWPRAHVDATRPGRTGLCLPLPLALGKTGSGQGRAPSRLPGGGAPMCVPRTLWQGPGYLAGLALASR